MSASMMSVLLSRYISMCTDVLAALMAEMRPCASSLGSTMIVTAVVHDRPELFVPPLELPLSVPLSCLMPESTTAAPDELPEELPPSSGAPPSDPPPPPGALVLLVEPPHARKPATKNARPAGGL